MCYSMWKRVRETAARSSSRYNQVVVTSGVNDDYSSGDKIFVVSKEHYMCANAPILVVDDDPSLRALVASTLELEGHAVLTAPDGTVALSFFEEFQPMMILLDKAMPGMDGPGFARELRARGFATPIVVISGSEGGQRFARAINAEGYISKPFKLPQLISTVEDLMTKCRSRLTTDFGSAT
jgi:CheY-like chemotaxis protein